MTNSDFSEYPWLRVPGSSSDRTRWVQRQATRAREITGVVASNLLEIDMEDEYEMMRDLSHKFHAAVEGTDFDTCFAAFAAAKNRLSVLVSYFEAHLDGERIEPDSFEHDLFEHILTPLEDLMNVLDGCAM
ncbi:hypothetical protein HDU88_008419 [Geranomyces variabilis]|nr:hypothetical protein HDU88_008419 [Geranomyces variabilis]